MSLPRSDLATALFHTIEGKAETIFGDSVAVMQQAETGVHVTFESGANRDFDLVVGADGLHSRIRELVFGPESRFEKPLEIKVAAFETAGYRPRDEGAYVLYTQVGQQIARFSMRGDRTMFLFTFAEKAAEATELGDVSAQKALLRKRFGNSGWESGPILDALDATTSLYFDRVSQIRMRPGAGGWSRGRVTLVGDAASCVSLLAGEGSGLAMVAAYILAGELHRADGDYRRAFARYEERFGPFVHGKQSSALRFASTFAPKSLWALFLRNQIMNLLAIRWIANLTVGYALTDPIALPEY